LVPVFVTGIFGTNYQIVAIWRGAGAARVIRAADFFTVAEKSVVAFFVYHAIDTGVVHAPVQAVFCLGMVVAIGVPALPDLAVDNDGVAVQAGVFRWIVARDHLTRVLAGGLFELTLSLAVVFTISGVGDAVVVGWRVTRVSLPGVLTSARIKIAQSIGVEFKK
jgi:hypothetical protein